MIFHIHIYTYILITYIINKKTYIMNEDVNLIVTLKQHNRSSAEKASKYVIAMYNR